MQVAQAEATENSDLVAPATDVHTIAPSSTTTEKERLMFEEKQKREERENENGTKKLELEHSELREEKEAKRTREERDAAREHQNAQSQSTVVKQPGPVVNNSAKAAGGAGGGAASTATANTTVVTENYFGPVTCLICTCVVGCGCVLLALPAPQGLLPYWLGCLALPLRHANRHRAELSPH